jgi:hypothetical protein
VRLICAPRKNIIYNDKVVRKPRSQQQKRHVQVNVEREKEEVVQDNDSLMGRVRRVGLDKILVARELARLVASSARLDSARFNFTTS